ncbi:hypothetical protein FNF29_00940 [Cafeteria roenbergensis]|uniref:Uncharacterized protein n=1 Tax=Cafeteria roenbergensis TaxID=33653 RepID=A0A5A8CXD2_CAFRO|nr:hypothetical protein FNF29_00940 [Cafeteria roenbergensis]|eukprot:KAA0156830.1 hypothetical protein FNF29_00940 [Cafeteria roenbergensis]
MSLRAQVSNGVRVYNLAATKSLPEWLKDGKSRKALRRNDDFVRRVELIQDFAYPTAASCITMTPDQQFIVTAGEYPPQIRVYDVQELSLKFERHLDSGVVRTVCLSQDWRKLALLHDDRFIELHAQAGRHARVRIPRFGRDMALRAESAELLVPAAGGQMFRLSLEAGRFMAPLESSSPGLNRVSVCAATGLVAAGGEDGFVEIWDMRAKRRASRIHALDARANPARGAAPEAGCEVTSLLLDSGAMTLVTGASDGHAVVHDIRSSRPRLTVDHRSDEPIGAVRLVRPQHPGASPLLMTADRTSIRFWDRASGALFTALEPGCGINDVVLAGEAAVAGAAAHSSIESAIGGESDASRVTRDSGLVLVAGEQSRMVPMYVPDLGPAPRWASYIDTLTEELEEGKSAAAAAVGKEDTSGAVFEDYKFVAKQDLDKLGLSHLVGTPLLHAYMHGFYIDRKLYQRAIAAADPDAYSRWQASKRAKAAEKEDRILLQQPRRRTKVNHALAAKLQAAAAAAGPDGEEGGGPSLVGDDRFGKVFSDPAFAVDDDAAAFFDLRRGGASGRAGQAVDSDGEDEGGGDGEEWAGAPRRRKRPRPAHDDADDEDAGVSVGALLAASGAASSSAARGGSAAGADPSGMDGVRLLDGGGREKTFVPSGAAAKGSKKARREAEAAAAAAAAVGAKPKKKKQQQQRAGKKGGAKRSGGGGKRR